MFFAKLKQELSKLENQPHVDQGVWAQFWDKVEKKQTKTKLENNPEHFCAFFVPIHRPTQSIYLGHHIKADDWIPPGGHLDQGELPIEAVIREMKEELGYTITNEPVALFNLSIKPIYNHPLNHCTKHFDWWHGIIMPEKTNFRFDRGEFHDAGWFSLSEGMAKITKNPEFKQIVEKINEQFFS